jgi:hypothetical protein
MAAKSEANHWIWMSVTQMGQEKRKLTKKSEKRDTF